MSTPYYEARLHASRRDPRLSNRQRAADQLYVSLKSLADYETGQTVPPCDVVQRMREVYGAHDLVGAHIRAYCPLMTDYGSSTPSELAQAALGWAVAMGDAQEVARQFAQVARDGRITAAEVSAAKLIREKARQIELVMQETVTAIDKALEEVGG